MNQNIHFKFKNILIAGCCIMLLLPLSKRANAAATLFSSDSASLKEDMHVSVFSTDFDTNKLITCYPNPAVSYISFKFDNTVQRTSKLLIYSFTGRKMDEFYITNNLIKITLENYYRGLYIYQLRDAADKIIESGKFQVKN